MSVAYQQLVSDSLYFPPESGALARSDKYLRNRESGKTWFGRGLTMFLLYARMLRGEDIKPQLRWARSVGANYLRIFGPVPTPPWDPEWDFYSEPDPSLLSQLGRFASTLASEGLRLEFTPLCGPWPMDVSRVFLREAYAQLSGKWNVFLEATNEPGQAGTFNLNLHTLIDGVDRRGVLSSTGIAWWLRGDTSHPPSKECQSLIGKPHMESVADIHWLDYGTGHFNGTEFAGTENARYPRNSKAARDWRDGDAEVQMPGSGRPTWLDEDARVDDTDSYPGVEDHVCHNAIGCLYSGSQLIHFNAGKFGLVPQPGGLEDRVIRETTKLWHFFPPEAQEGRYVPAHFAEFPLYWTNADSTVRHAYSSMLDAKGIAYVVNCLPPKGWKARPKDGWKVLEEGPRPWILKVGRV